MTRQSINYKYNIRGWLTDINNVNLGMLGEYQFPMSAYDDLFSFKIMYNEIFEDTGNGAQPLFNGNIAQTFWKTGSNNKLRGYDYSYDSLNRLLRAEFYNSEVQPYTGAYNEIINYDLNGNITSLNRTTGDNSGAAVAMDELTYTYKDGNGNSNVLLNVSDAVSPQSTDGFIDGNTDPTLNDYEYDQNGNMILDRNKGITEIKYNHLNLPTQITWANNKYISYQYNAAGQKVRKTVDNNDSLKIVDYLDGFQYAGNILQFFPTAEGYVKATRLDKSQTELSFNYIYNYTDHLGNVRVSYTLDPQTGKLRIVDEHHYYPFGLRHEVHYPSGNRLDFHPTTTFNGGQVGDPVQLINVTKTEYMYRYNGKEFQDELGLDWYDYHARNYDSAIGRWMNVDPMSPKYFSHSPYVYALNAPTYFIDPDGMQVEPGEEIFNEDDPIVLETVTLIGKAPIKSSGSLLEYIPRSFLDFSIGKDILGYDYEKYSELHKDPEYKKFYIKMSQAKREGEWFVVGLFATPFAIAYAPAVLAYGSVAMETWYGSFIIKTGIDATAQYLITGDVNWLNAAAGSVLPGKVGTALSPIMSEGADISRNLINNEPINFEKSLLKVGTGYIGNGLGGTSKLVGQENGFNAFQNFIFQNGIQSFHNTLQTTIIDTKVD